MKLFILFLFNLIFLANADLLNKIKKLTKRNSYYVSPCQQQQQQTSSCPYSNNPTNYVIPQNIQFYPSYPIQTQPDFTNSNPSSCYKSCFVPQISRCCFTGRQNNCGECLTNTSGVCTKSCQSNNSWGSSNGFPTYFYPQSSQYPSFSQSTQ